MSTYFWPHVGLVHIVSNSLIQTPKTTVGQCIFYYLFVFILKSTTRAQGIRLHHDRNTIETFLKVIFHV